MFRFFVSLRQVIFMYSKMKRTLQLVLTALFLTMVIAPAPLRAKDFKVISYNIRNSSSAQADGDNCWENRRKATLKMIKKEKPDMIGMQEVLPDQFEYINKHTRKSYGHVGVGRDDGKNEGEIMCIYYNSRRFDLLDSSTHWLSETPDVVSLGWDGACRRTVTYVLLQEKKTGKKIAYFNTHLDHVGPVARRESVLLLCRLIGQLAPAGVPVILGGDMNSTITDSIFRPLDDCGMLVARDIAPQTDNRGTYNGWGKANEVIDHFFVRGVKPLEFHCLDGDYGVPFISDHYPISFQFRLKK